MIFRSILHLSERGIQQKYNDHHMSSATWIFDLVALLTIGVAPDDYVKTPCPRMNQRTLVPSDIINSTECLSSISTSHHLSLIPRFHALHRIVISDASNDEFESVLSL